MDFSKDTDADLLGYIGLADDDADTAREAWGEFFVRNRRYLFGVVRSCYGRDLGGDEGAEDLVVETFQAAHEWARRNAHQSGKLDGFRDSTPQLVQRRVRAWLGKIAENRFKDILRRHEYRPDEVEHPEQLAEHVARLVPSLPAQELLAKLAAALATLSEQDQEALRVCLPWYDGEKFHFGPGEAEAVAAELGTNPDALRQRRHRALQRLKKAMNEQPAPTTSVGART